MQAIILAAGEGKRCQPLTLTRPKPMLHVANKPILCYHLDNLCKIVKEVIIVVGYLGNIIREQLGDKYKGLSIRYFEQKGLRGTGDAMLQVMPLIKGKFMVIVGDDMVAKEDIKALSTKDNCVLVSRVAHPEFFGVVETQGNVIKRIVEKPSKPSSNLVNTAVYVFEPEIFKYLKRIKPSNRGELEFTDAVNLYAKHTKVAYLETRGDWLPISHSWKLLDANQSILQDLKPSISGRVESGAKIKGKLILGKDSIVKSGAYIEGDVIVGQGTVIGPNCYIRGSTAIGSGCKVGNAVEIKNSILMDGTKVGHLSYIGDSVLGFNVNIGAGTIVANLRHDNANVKTMINGNLVDTGRRKFGTIIGDSVHTGINTSIYPGRKLWPNTTTRPGEIVAEDKTEE
ncbi:glucose-1-phosphate thymidylyltransferase [Candidatus Woesearchaeota archaeon]|nr:NTP transferase domain-containing protein [Candidatus Woesearchaeota archaeon]RLE43184.1 MAG: glucose-1-phosphate thymidylyltransferase [Candidatus Woesearchaeota archaeon]